MVYTTLVDWQRFSLIQNNRHCFTIFNYTNKTVYDLKEFARSAECLMMVFGFEKAPTTQRPHIQGYCILRPYTGMHKLHQYLNHLVWHTKANGSTEQNMTYCTKDDNHWCHDKILGAATQHLPLGDYYLFEEDNWRYLHAQSVLRRYQFLRDFTEEEYNFWNNIPQPDIMLDGE